MTTEHARKILADCGVTVGTDFYTLGSVQVACLLDWAATCRYRKPKNANGSTGRYFHAMLQRHAEKDRA